MINLSFVILYGAIWLAAVTGYVKLSQYADLIRKNKDGKAFAAIALGLGFLAFRLPLSSVINASLLYISRGNPEITAASVIIVNYLGVIFSVLAFGYISYGAEQLLELVPSKNTRRTKHILLLVALVLAAAYTQLAIGRAGYDRPLVAGGKASYYLPSWLIVSTIIIPYAYVWYMGFVSVFSLLRYRNGVKGLLYKQGLRWLYAGISVVIATSVLLQFGGAQTIRVSRFEVQPILISSYIFLIILAVGFGCIVAGAKRLKRIEEV